MSPVPGRLLARARAPASVCVVTPDGRLVITSPLDSSTSVRELATGKVVASIRTAGLSMCFDLHPWRPFLTCGDQAKTVSLIEIPGLDYGPIVVTARERLGQAGLFVCCPCCRLEHRIDHAELGGEHRCPTPGCALRLRLNSFFSSRLPATPKPAPITLTGEELDGIIDFLIGSLWYGLNQTWRFHRDARSRSVTSRPRAHATSQRP
jgi:hypothetical protein